MKLPDKLNWMLRTPPLTRTRIAFAMAAAMAADGLQLGVLGSPPFGEMIDLLAMVFVSLCIGLHPLLLPTFVLEFFPFVDVLPTWTGCTIAVIALRKRRLRK